MRKILISSALIIGIIINLSACSSKNSAISALADPSKYYSTTFGQGKIIDINIDIDNKDWQDLQTNAKAEKYHSANITVNGTTVKNVGFRTKGFSSLNSVANSNSNRYGFKVKLDEYVKNQKLNGLDTIVLNGSFSDPSYMREYLTYAASNYLGCITPNLAYSRLSINGKLFGFYLCIESYDDSFMKRNKADDNAVLYKAVSENCTLLPNDNGNGFDIVYGKDNNDKNIRKLVSVLNSTTNKNKEKLEAILNIDSVLKAIAVNTVMGNYDSYSGSKAHNYYLMYSDGKFSYIGWDYNMSIGGFMEDNGSSVTADISSPVYNVDISRRPLIQKLLAIDEYNKRYKGYIKSLTKYFSNFNRMVKDIAKVIRKDVKNDSSAFYTIKEFESSIKASNTDLTKMKNNKNNFGDRNYRGNMQFPNRNAPDMQGGQRPDASTGQAPDGPGNNGQTDKPNDKNSNVQNDRNMPNRPNNWGPDMQDGNFGNRPPNGAGGMLNKNTVSIVDYITQRVTYINKNNK